MSDEPRNLPEDFYDKGDGSEPPQPAQEPTNPYAQQPPYGAQPPYGQPTAPYGQPQPSYGQAPYGTQPYGYNPLPPSHPSATTSMVLGIIGLAGIMFCGGLTLVLSPFAWVMGRRAVQEIDAQPGRYSGRDQARGGQIMGMIGTVLLILGVLAIALAIGLLVSTDWEGVTTTYEYSTP